jgi:hypothetical protein
MSDSGRSSSGSPIDLRVWPAVSYSDSLPADWRGKPILAATATDTEEQRTGSEQMLGWHQSDRPGRHDFHGH